MAPVQDDAMTPAPTTLYRNGCVYSPADPYATALLVADGRIAWLGADADAPAADGRVDLAGALVTPAFVDAHVHCTDTGVTLLGLDLAGTRSRVEVLDAVAAHAAGLASDAVVVGHGWDESGWAGASPPDAAELDRAAGGRWVYLAQASAHSAVVSGALLSAVPDATTAAGFDASGWLRRDAHHRVREVALGTLTSVRRREAQRAALRRAAASGIAAVHECGGPGVSGEADFADLLALAAAGGLPEVYGYWGELGAVEKARELGAVGAGGDLFVDGALGSWTAHLREPYLDSPGGGCGYGYLDAGQVAAHLVECVRLGMQGGFHAIGDGAVATVLAGFAAAARAVGLERLRAGRHRVEHLELLDGELIRGLVGYGVTASVQPAFDRSWGGSGGMYARRLGVQRALASNPIGALVGVGVALAFGSDSPVTPLDPWGGVRAAMCHHNPVYRISARAAFAAHTRGGWRAVPRGGAGGSGYGRSEVEGVLVPGAPATFAVWDVAGVPVGNAPGGRGVGLPSLLPDGPGAPPAPVPACRRTVVRGRVIFDEEES